MEHTSEEPQLTYEHKKMLLVAHIKTKKVLVLPKLSEILMIIIFLLYISLGINIWWWAVFGIVLSFSVSVYTLYAIEMEKRAVEEIYTASHQKMSIDELLELDYQSYIQLERAKIKRTSFIKEYLIFAITLFVNNAIFAIIIFDKFFL